MLLDDQGGAVAHFNNMFAVNDGGGGGKRASINNSFATANQDKDRFLKYIWRNKLNRIYDFVVVKEKNQAQFLIEEAYQDILSIATLNELNFLCDHIAANIICLHRGKYGTNFFATQSQLSRETREHIVGYLCAMGEPGYGCPLVFVAYYAIANDKNGLSLREYILRKCKSAEYCRNSRAENLWYYGDWGW